MVAIHDDGHFRFLHGARVELRARLVGVFRDAGGEQFDLDVLLGHAGRLQGGGDAQHHVFRAADEGVVVIFYLDPVLQELLAFFLRDAAVEQFDILLLAAHHVHQVQTLQVHVLQVRQFFLEDDGRRGAVAVKQSEAAQWFRQQGRLDDGEDGRDAAAGRKRQVVLAVDAVERHVEVAHGRHHLDGGAGLERIVRPGRESAAGRALDGHAQRAVLHRRTDRIRAAHVFRIDIGAQGQVLALLEAELLLQFGRHVERDGDGVARFIAHVRYAQRIKFTHASSPVSSERVPDFFSGT